VSRDIDHVTTGKVGADDADATRIDHRIGHCIVDGVEPVIDLLPRIDIAT
jgi:hypothetical protein